MFDVIAHKEGAKLLQKRFNLKEVEKYEGVKMLKEKTRTFHGYRDWIFIGGQKR